MLPNSIWGLIGLAGLLWGMMYVPDLQPFRQLMMWASVVSILAAIGLSIYWLMRKSESSGRSQISAGDNSPNFGDQKGKNNIQVFAPVTNHHTQIVNPKEPQPRIRILGPDTITDNNDGTFSNVKTFEVVASTTPGNLLVTAYGPTVVDMRVSCHGGMMGSGGPLEGGFGQLIQTPFGTYSARIQTKGSAGGYSMGFDFNVRM